MKVVKSKYPELNFEPIIENRVEEVFEETDVFDDLNEDEIDWVDIEGGYRNYISENIHRVYDAVDAWSMFEDNDEVIDEEINYLINEKNYKELRAAVTPFLQVRAKSRNTPGSVFTGFSNNVMRFKTNSHRLRDVVYTQMVRLVDLDDIIKKNPNKGMVDIARMALQGNIKVHCSDPSWLYWGFEYIGTQKGYSINREIRPPNKRNPGRSGSVCKHLDNVLYILPFQATKLANYLKTKYKPQ